MHKLFFEYYCFIKKYQIHLINSLPKNTTLIYRNYQNPVNYEILLKLKKICRAKKLKFYLSNDIKLAIKLKLDGAYIPAFNKNFSHNTFKLKKNFDLIGSAHNLSEIKIKELQKVSTIFLSPIFRTKKHKHFLGIYKFLNLMKLTKKNIVCLGGVNKNNLKNIQLINIKRVASISMFQRINDQ